MRLIDADPIISTIKGLYALTDIMNGHREKSAVQVAERNAINEIVKMIEKTPTIESERKTGKWVRALDGNDGHVRCDKCFKIYDWDTQAQYYDFCPNCGADMREPEDIPMEYFESGGETNRMPELKPCPFCGGTDLHLESFFGCGNDVIVCYECLATFTQQEIICEEDLVEAWNRRAGEQE